MNKSIFEYNNEEIDLSIIFNFFARNKKLIIFISLISTSITIISTYIKKPVWVGEFQIILQNNQNPSSEISNFNIPDQIVNKNTTLNTQVAILKSPLVLSTVFEKVRNEKIQKNLNSSNLDYKSWLRKSLQIQLKKGTSVLEIKYRDTDKEIILNALNLISSRYQEFSKRDRQREINQGIEYLKLQKQKLISKTESSQMILFDFIEKNNLQINDNFYSKPLNEKIVLSSKELNNSSRVDNFNSDFKRLGNYESELIEKSGIFKPSSRVIKNLELKIKNLRNSLKRPQEILAKYKTLSGDAQRNISLLNKISADLELLKLEKAKKQLPWELISQPKLDRFRFSPKRKQETFLALITSLSLGSLIAGIMELKSNKIFSINDFKKFIDYPILSFFFFNQQKLNLNLLKNFANKDNVSSIENICLVSLSLDDDKNKEMFGKLFNKDPKLNYVFIEDIDILKRFEKVYLFAEMSNIYKNEMPLINQYLTLISSSIGGVFIIEKNN